MSFRNVQFAVLVRLQLELHCNPIDQSYNWSKHVCTISTFGAQSFATFGVI